MALQCRKFYGSKSNSYKLTGIKTGRTVALARKRSSANLGDGRSFLDIFQL
jgi:hypothetical protein